MPNFNLVGLDTVVNLTENVEYPEYVPPDISGAYFMHLYEAPELINDIFHFKTTDPELTTSTADNDMAFKCEPTKWPDLPFSEGLIRNDIKQDIKTYSVPPGYHDRITKNIGVQWLAKNITGGYNNSDIFANEKALQQQYVNLDSSGSYTSNVSSNGIKEKLEYKLSLGGSDSVPLSNADTTISNISRQIFNSLIGKTSDNSYRKGKSIEKTRQRINDMIVTQQSNQRYIITNYDGIYNSITNKLVDKKGTNNADLPTGESLSITSYNNPEINNRYDTEWGTYVHFDGSTYFTQTENYTTDLDHNNYSISMVVKPTSDLSFVIFDNNNLTIDIDIVSLTLNTWHNINLTVNNGKLKIYNGVTELTDLSKNLLSYPSLSSAFSIGASTSNTNNFVGDLASFLVLNKACTPQELVNLQRELYPNAINPPNQYVEEKWNALKFKEHDVMEFGLRYLVDGISESGYAKDSVGNILGTNKLENQNYVCRINMKYSKVRWVASHIYLNTLAANFSNETTANILDERFMIYGNPFPLNNDNNIELTIDCSSFTGGLQYVGLILIESGDASFNESNPFNGTSGNNWINMATNGPSIGLYSSEYSLSLGTGSTTRIFKWVAAQKILYVWNNELDTREQETVKRGINPEKYKYAVPCVMKSNGGNVSGSITISSTTPYFLRDIPGQGAADQWYYNPYHLNYEDMSYDPSYNIPSH